MPTGPLNRVIDCLRHAALVPDVSAPTDGLLLARFARQRDEDAFATLLRRHGPMVMGVCRRVLMNQHDAEDAFQATFLILARKAGSVAAPNSLGGWLYRVAYRTALEARARIARSRAKEKQVRDMPNPEIGAEEPWRELLPLLDRELDRLPEKYRLPVVLCELEGRSRKEVACQLQIPEGTLSSRLAQARKLLARRLSSHSAGALALALARPGPSACVSVRLLRTTARAALQIATGQSLKAGVVSAEVVSLTEGMLKAMFLSKLKTIWAVALVVALGASVLGLSYRPAVAQPGPGTTSAPPSSGKLSPPSQAVRVAPDDLEELRLEIAALRKGLEATRARVKALEGEVRTLRAGRPTWSNVTDKAGFDNLPKQPGNKSQWSVKPDDPLNDALTALKKLKQQPDDKQAAEALERALNRLQEQEKRRNPKDAYWQSVSPPKK